MSSRAEGNQDIFARVVTLGKRDRADRLGHVGVGDADKTLRESQCVSGSGQLGFVFGGKYGLGSICLRTLAALERVLVPMLARLRFVIALAILGLAAYTIAARQASPRSGFKIVDCFVDK